MKAHHARIARQQQQPCGEGRSRLVIMFLITIRVVNTIMLLIIDRIKIFVVIATKVIAINLNSSPETRMESPCATPAVFITNYTT